MSDEKMEDLGCLPTGAHLYRKRNSVGGWRYYSDECGCMSVVWDTCLANKSTLLAAILSEQHRIDLEVRYNGGWRPNSHTEECMKKERMVATDESLFSPIENGSVDRSTVPCSGEMTLDDQEGGV